MYPVYLKSLLNLLRLKMYIADTQNIGIYL